MDRVCGGARCALTILAICGSIRAASSNATILRVATRLAPATHPISIYDGLTGLPYFNPDLDRELGDPLLPPTVQDLRHELGKAEALIISSPEYAHGVPGVLKNALDWLVGGPEMVGKRVALFNTAPHAIHAQASLAETLRTMTATLVEHAFLLRSIPRGVSDDDLMHDTELSREIRGALAALILNDDA